MQFSNRQNLPKKHANVAQKKPGTKSMRRGCLTLIASFHGEEATNCTLLRLHILRKGFLNVVAHNVQNLFLKDKLHIWVVQYF